MSSRVRLNVDDRTTTLFKTKGPHFEGFWVFGASSNNGGVHPAKGYCNRLLVWNMVDTLLKWSMS